MIIKPSRKDILLGTRGSLYGSILGVGLVWLLDKDPHYASLFGYFTGMLMGVFLVSVVSFRQTQEWATFIISKNSIEGPSGAFISGKRVKFDLAQITQVKDKRWFANPKIVCGNQKITIPSFINNQDCQQILSYVKERIPCADVSP